MAETDPVQAIRDAIEHLEAAIAPVHDQIEQIRRDADDRIKTLEAQVADQRRELRRWQAALDRAEGRASAPAKRRRRSRAPEVSDEQLVAALRDAGEPVSASQLRTALGIGEDVAAAKVTRLLAAAVDRGAIVRSGERRATRYAAP